MKLKRVVIVFVYACFVLLNVVPVDACAIEKEMTCCSSSCCADEPMDCCVADDEENQHADDHGVANPLKLKTAFSDIQPALVERFNILCVEDNHEFFSLERPPPKTIKTYIAYQQLILYA